MIDIKSMARGQYNPSRFQSGYRREKAKLRQLADEVGAAEHADWGSAAARKDPTRWGSAARRDFGSLFRPEPAKIPTAKLPDSPLYEKGYFDPSVDAKQRDAEEQKSRLKRRSAADDFGFDSLDQLLESLGRGM